MWLSRNGLRLGFVLVMSVAGGRRGCCSGCYSTSGSGCSAGSGSCNYPTPPPCGNLNGACCNGSNNGDSGVIGCLDPYSCVRNVCVTPDTNCGASGQRCCSEVNCDTGLVCAQGACVTCGGPGQHCCVGQCPGGGLCRGGYCEVADAGRRDAGVDAGPVARCGGPGEACCDGADCDESLVCAPLYAAPDADAGEVEDAADVVDVADAADVADVADANARPPVPRVCQPCGSFSNPCCGGVACDPGLSCQPADVARCLPCGAAGQRCCAGGGCDDGARCGVDAGLCEATDAGP